MAVDRHPYSSRRARLIPIAFVPYSLLYVDCAHACPRQRAGAGRGRALRRRDDAAGKRGFVTLGCAA
jgi:hypothetical protein